MSRVDHWVILPILCLAAFGCASSGGLRGGAADIHRIKKIVDAPAVRDSTAVETRYVRVVRREAFGVLDSLSARQGMPLTWTDTMLLASQWRTRLRVGSGLGEWDWAVLLPELQTARGELVMGPRAGVEGGLYSIWSDPAGTRLDVHRGALVLKDWGSGAICVRLAGACVSTTKASYAVRSLEDGRGELFVGSGQVTVTRGEEWNPACVQLADQPVAVSCGLSPDRQRTVVGEGGILSWGPDSDFLRRGPEGSEEERRLRDAIQYNGEDLWRDRRFPWPVLLAIPAAVVVCATTDILFCGGGGGDLDARVRLVP